ncbi:hypothetical protein KKD61_04220 [Patescibacteria group bacterium]|nr:hypothetical protein [Patescibacteria group bacterium]
MLNKKLVNIRSMLLFLSLLSISFLLTARRHPVCAMLTGKGVTETFEEGCGNIPGYPDNPFFGFGDPPMRRTISDDDIRYYLELGLDWVVIGGTGPAGWDNIVTRYPGVSLGNSPININLGNWNDPNYDFAELDRVITLLKQNGIEPLLGSYGPPRWAVKNPPVYEPNPHCVDMTPNSTLKKEFRQVTYGGASSNTYQEFMAALADRYNGTHGGLPKVKYFILGNEQNIADESPQDTTGLASRIAFLNHAYQAIKNKNPSAEVIVGNLSPLLGPDPGCNQANCAANDNRTPSSWLTFTHNQELLFDHLGYHPYLYYNHLPPSQQPSAAERPGSFFPSTTIGNLVPYLHSFSGWESKSLAMTEAGIWGVRGVLSEQTIAQNTSAIFTSLVNANIYNWSHFLLEVIPQWDSGLLIRPKMQAHNLFWYQGQMLEIQTMPQNLWVRKIYSLSPVQAGQWNHYSLTSLNYPTEITSQKNGAIATQYFYEYGNSLRESITLGNKYWYRLLDLSINGEAISFLPGAWYSNTLKSAWDIYPTRPYFTNLDSRNISRISVNGTPQYIEFTTAGNEYWLRYAPDISQLGNFTHGLLKNYFSGHTSNNSRFPHPPSAGIDAHYFVQEGNVIYESFIAGNRYWGRTGTDFTNMNTHWWTDDFNSFSPATTYNDQCQPTSFAVPFNRVCRRPVFDTLKNFDFKSHVPTITPTADCPTDLNQDGVVNSKDLIILIKIWGQVPQKSEQDLFKDNKINVLDLDVIIRNWGTDGCR